MKGITFKIKEEDWDAVDKYAKSQQRSKSSFVRFCILEAIKKNSEVVAE